MQLTVEFDDASQIAALAHIAEMMNLARNDDSAAIRGLYPLHMVHSMNAVLDALDYVLNYIDSPYAVNEFVGRDAGSMANRMQEIGQRILDMKNDFPDKAVSRK